MDRPGTPHEDKAARRRIHSPTGRSFQRLPKNNSSGCALSEIRFDYINRGRINRLCKRKLNENVGHFFVKGGHGLTRIVYTTDLRKRWSEWQAASPFDLTLVGMVTNNDSRLALGQTILHRLYAKGAHHLAWVCVHPEARTHGLFAAVVKLCFEERRVRGDWFALDDTTLQQLRLERP